MSEEVAGSAQESSNNGSEALEPKDIKPPSSPEVQVVDASRINTGRECVDEKNQDLEVEASDGQEA